MNQFRCDQCKRVHTRSKKCIYCGAGARYQKPTATVSTATPRPAPKIQVKAIQLEFSINSPAPLQAEAADPTT